MNRRTFLKSMGSATALAFGGLAGLHRLAAAGRRQPNIIVILSDDLGYGDIQGFGVEKSPFQTPNLTRMAAEGAKLTEFYVPTPYCAPSRATLLTGRYPFHTGMVFNPAPDSGINEIGLPDDEVTLAEALKPAGYASLCIGKWHLGHLPQYLPRRQGFDEYFGILYSNDMFPVQLVENETVVEYPVVQATLTKRYTERAVDFIDRNYRHNTPFFLYLAHAMPHKPLAASEDFYTPDTPDDLYADVIRELDWSVGQVLDKVRNLGIDDNTIVLFLSDNGPWYGGSTGGLRGMKARNWEGGLRVPFIAWWPGTIPAGVVNRHPAGSIDIFPTLLNQAGVDLPDAHPIDGKNLWPQLMSADAPGPHEALFSMHDVRLMTVLSGKWKLHIRSPGPIPDRGPDWVDPRRPDGVHILAPYEQARPTEYPGVMGGDGPRDMMLFNIEKDPAEQHDVSDQYPAVAQRLEDYYNRMMETLPTFQRPKRDFQGLRRIKGGDLKYGRVGE